MNHLKALAASVAIASAVVVAAPASAAAYGSGQSFDGVTTTNGTFGNSSITKGTGFSDVFSFTVTNSGLFDIDLTYLVKTNISNFAASFNNESFVISKSDGSFGGTVSQYLDVGTYALTVSGNTSPKIGGSYTGNVLFSAVPEPAAWALMMLGFGGIGMVLRRRSTKVVFKLA